MSAEWFYRSLRTSAYQYKSKVLHGDTSAIGPALHVHVCCVYASLGLVESLIVQLGEVVAERRSSRNR